MNQHGEVLLVQPDDPERGRPEVLRGDLRRMLLDALAPGTIQWGSKATAVPTTENGGHAVTFADGSVATADLLIRADSAWSKVRSLLSNAKPTYVGVSFIETWLHDCESRHTLSAKAVGGGALFRTRSWPLVLEQVLEMLGH